MKITTAHPRTVGNNKQCNIYVMGIIKERNKWKEYLDY